MEAVLDRRLFLKLSAAGTAVAVVSVPTLGCDTQWIDTVLNDLPTVISIAESIVAVVAEATGNGALSGAAAQLITGAANLLVAALTALKEAVNAYQANKNSGTLAEVIAALNAAQTSVANVVSALVQAGVAVSSDIQMIITAAMGVAATILAAIQTLIPGAAPAAVTTASGVTFLGQVKVPNAATIRYGYNSVLRMHKASAHGV